MPRIHLPGKNGKPSEPLNKRNELVRTEIENKLDHLTELWNAIEGKILSMQPPRHISMIYGNQFDEHTGATHYELLGLQRHGGKWRVCYASGCDYDDGPAEWRPIIDCSTEIRVEAAKHIESLMEEVVKSGKEYIPQVDEAVRSLENALGDV